MGSTDSRTVFIGKGEMSLSSDYLISIRDFALSKGINTTTLLAGSDIPLDALLDPPPRIGEVSMYQVGKNLVNALENPLVASIEFGHSMSLSTHGFLGVAVQGTHNLQEAGQLLLELFKTRNGLREITINEDKFFYCLRLTPNLFFDFEIEEQIRLFFDLSILVNIEILARQFLGTPNLSGKAILNINVPEPENFPHSLLEDSIEFHFDTSHFELCLPKIWMTVSVDPINPELATAATNKCRDELLELTPKDLLEEVRQRIRNTLHDKPTIKDIAQQLFMSTSTLQRRLREEKTTFKALKDNERLVLAKNLLTDKNSSIDIISEQLGFSDTSNFTKSFKSWSGLTPNNYRKSQ